MQRQDHAPGARAWRRGDGKRAIILKEPGVQTPGSMTWGLLSPWHSGTPTWRSEAATNGRLHVPCRASPRRYQARMKRILLALWFALALVGGAGRGALADLPSQPAQYGYRDPYPYRYRYGYRYRPYYRRHFFVSPPVAPYDAYPPYYQYRYWAPYYQYPFPPGLSFQFSW
jgi:hypothetical protein